MNIGVVNHHGSFRYDIATCVVEDCDTLVTWTDWPFEGAMRSFKSKGGKLIVFEHGRNAFWDYYLNDRPMIADLYLAWGKSGKDAIEEANIAQGLNKRVKVIGCPIFDGIRHKRSRKSEHLNVLFVAMHWARDVTEFNSRYLLALIKCLNDTDTLTVKAMEKSGIIMDGGIGLWTTEVENPDSLAQIKKEIRKYDLVVTPHEGTFELFARFNGIPVINIDTKEEYRLPGEPNNYSRLWENSFTLDRLQEAIYLAREDKLYMPSFEEVGYECQRPSISKDNLLKIIESV